MTIFYIISTLLMIVGVLFIFKLTPEQITHDLNWIISPDISLRDRSKIARGKKKANRLTVLFNNTREALKATGKEKQFTLVCASALFLFIFGFTVSIFIDNVFLAPVAAVAMASIPFLYVKSTLDYYNRMVAEEVETALSIVTISYERTNNLVKAIEVNINNIKPPIKSIFEQFIFRVNYVSPDIKTALFEIKEKIDNDIYREWCDCLIQCQDDHTLIDTLTPIVKKLTDVRIINNELKVLVTEPKVQYHWMVAFVVLNIPIMYLINPEWFYILVGSVVGKLTLAISFIVILVTGFYMIKFTKPIEYKK